MEFLANFISRDRHKDTGQKHKSVVQLVYAYNIPVCKVGFSAEIRDMGHRRSYSFGRDDCYAWIGKF